MLRKTAAGFVKHPVWTTVGAVIGVVGVAFSAIQLFVPQRVEISEADLEVALVDIGRPEPTNGVRVDRAGNYPDSPAVVGVTPIDITLKNNGGKPALISRVDAEVLFYDGLLDCTMSGAGPAVVTGLYSLAVPADDYGDVEAGTVISKDMKFEVKPGSVDRMVVTVGPSDAGASFYPTVMAVRLSLVHDGASEPLEIGAVSVASTSEAVEAQIERGADAKCAIYNLEVLNGLYEVQALRADDLEAMRRKFQQLAG